MVESLAAPGTLGSDRKIEGWFAFLTLARTSYFAILDRTWGWGWGVATPGSLAP